MIKRITLLLGCCLLAGSSRAADPVRSPRQLLEAVEERYLQMEGVTATFTLVVESGDGESLGSFDGAIEMAGKAFHLITPELEVWYNGESLWTLLANSNEVNLTTPEPADMQSINPFALLTLYKSGYTPSAGKSAHSVVLTPQGEVADFEEVVFEIDAESLTPKSISATLDPDNILRATMVSYTATPKREDSLFCFPAERFPNLQVIDLR